MWKSIGDRFDIEPHNHQRHPRRIKTNVFAVCILILTFVVSSFTVREKLIALIGSDEVYDGIRMGVYILSLIATLLLIMIKYLKNDREIDVVLIFLMIILILICVL
mgnify:CR=1 FL=1